MVAEPLRNLTKQSAGIGKWTLKVATEPSDQECKWTKNGQSNTGRKLECIFVSGVSEEYCQGTFKRYGKEPQASKDFQAMKQQLKKGSMWQLSKVALISDKSLYISSSIKVNIDVNKSKLSPVLQSTVKMPEQATPPEDLSTLLTCPHGQRVDVTALLANMEEPTERQTANGPRLLVEVTIRDDSGEKSAASSSFALWLPASEGGRNEVATLKECMRTRTPVSFFNLICHSLPNEPTVLKTAMHGFFWQSCGVGQRAERLMKLAEDLLAKEKEDVLVVAELPSYAYENVDYLAMPANLTVCRVLDFTLRAGASLMDAATTGAPEHSEGVKLFQVNHARICEPRLGENYCTADNRLFPQVRVIDHTGALELRLREKVALEIANCNSKEDFLALAQTSAFNFPILCSFRVCVTKRTGAAEHELSSVIVEAETQDLYIPKAMPNASMVFVETLLQSLPPDADRMLVAPIGSLAHNRHGGMVVKTSSGQQLQASCVLSLVAHVGRSTVENLENGHKISSRNCWSIPFTQSPAVLEANEKEEGTPAYAHQKVLGEMASYCTMQNVQDYTLTSRKAKEALYALVVVSSVHEREGVFTYMLDKVSIIDGPGAVPTLCNLLHSLESISNKTLCSDKANATPEWREDMTPYSTKKPRRLSYSPTDDPIA